MGVKDISTYIYIYMCVCMCVCVYIYLVFFFFFKYLVQVRNVFLPDYSLVLSLLKPRDVRVFWNQKNPVQTKEAP